MISFMRLLVGAGLFAVGYYLGCQSCSFESQQGQPDLFDDPDADPEHEKRDPGLRKGH